MAPATSRLWRLLAGGLLTAVRLLVPVAVVLLLGVLIYHKLPWLRINAEDCGWIRGSDYGFPNRVLQRLVLSQVIPYFSGGLFEPFFMAAVGLHLLTALLIYALFLQLVGAMRSSYPQSQVARYIGAATAGLLFLCYQSVNLVYLSSLSYQLVTVATLLTLVLSLIYLERRHPLLWLLVVGAKLLAVSAHAFGMGVIGLVALVEVIWRRTTPGRPPLGRWWLRYILLVAAMAGHLVFYLPIYVRQVAKFGPGHGLPGSELVGLGYYIQLAVLELVNNTGSAIRHDFTQFGEPLKTMPIQAPLILLFALGVGALALVNLQRRRPLGLATMTLLGVLAWGGLAFLVTRRAPGWDHYMWRLSFSVAGLSLVVPFGILSLASRMTGRLTGWLSNLPAWLLLLGIILLTGPGFMSRGRDLRRLALSGQWLRNPNSCTLPKSCKTRPRLTLAQATREVRAGRSLACANLSGLDLSGLDLSGADLRWADLSWARLVETRLDGANLTGACLNWALLKRVTLKAADLTRASMAGSTLLYLDLTVARTGELDTHCRLDLKVSWPPGMRGPGQITD